MEEIVIPKLGSVSILEKNGGAEVTVRLADDYRGDLNDIERKNEFPASVYLIITDANSLNDPRLAKFIEVAHHWDHDGDGVFDADHMVEAIENALWHTTEAPNNFKRPSDGIYTQLLMRFMPPQPERQIIYSFGELRERFRWHHYVLALPTLIVLLAIINVQIAYAPWMHYSVITGFMAAGKLVGVNEWIALAVFVSGYLALRSRNKSSHKRGSMHTYGLFNTAAVDEEQSFREGAENWNWRQRTVSCLVFGAIHMVNLIYPLATILPLALGGAVFMAVYLRKYRQTKFRRSAVLSAALVHRVYNRLALATIVIWLISFTGLKIVGIVTAFALLAALAVVIRTSAKKHQTARLEPQLTK